MKKTVKIAFTLSGVLLFLSQFSGCAVAPPVQEMSDARQAIQAAREADAVRLAPGPLGQAEHYLSRATQELEQGDYDQAREAAIVAKEQAMQARDKAAGINGNL